MNNHLDPYIYYITSYDIVYALEIKKHVIILEVEVQKDSYIREWIGMEPFH